MNLADKNKTQQEQNKEKDLNTLIMSASIEQKEKI